jgi:5-methylcytosine-specific restriction enzyme A
MMLKEKASYAPEQSGSRTVTTKSYDRNAYVAEYAKRRANGTCQLCEESAPFKDKKGNPYLENHHIIWLANGGEDTIENTVALCPNCHRKMHSLNLEEDVQKLQEIARNTVTT